MPTIFITRQLETDSPLSLWAAAGGHTVIDRSLLTFTEVPFTPPQRADAWFFYSARAVEFSIGRVAQVQRFPKLGAMGSGTARVLEEAGWPVDFVGVGDPVAVARQFMEATPPGTVFFPRARYSRKSVQRMLSADYQILDAICYDNVPLDDPDCITADAYVFTSPLNVKAYLKCHPIPGRSRVVAIGPSTSKALTELGVKHVVAAEPSEAAIVSALK